MSELGHRHVFLPEECRLAAAEDDEPFGVSAPSPGESMRILGCDLMGGAARRSPLTAYFDAEDYAYDMAAKVEFEFNPDHPVYYPVSLRVLSFGSRPQVGSVGRKRKMEFLRLSRLAQYKMLIRLFDPDQHERVDCEAKVSLVPRNMKGRMVIFEVPESMSAPVLATPDPCLFLPFWPFANLRVQGDGGSLLFKD